MPHSPPLGACKRPIEIYLFWLDRALIILAKAVIAAPRILQVEDITLQNLC